MLFLVVMHKKRKNKEDEATRFDHRHIFNHYWKHIYHPLFLTTFLIFVKTKKQQIYH